MPESQYELSRDELIAYAKGIGETITAHQLVRWHKQGLLSRPRVQHHGKGKGTTSFYPSTMLRQATFLSLFLRQARSLEGATIRLWLAGFPVTAAFRVVFLRALDRSNQRRRNTIAAFEGEDPDNAIDCADRVRYPKQMTRIKRTHRSLYQRIVIDLQLGHFTLDDYTPADVLELFAQMGQDQTAITAHLEHVKRGPRIREELSMLSTVNLRAAVARLSDAQLEADRSRAIALWKAITEVSGLDLPLPENVFRAVLMVRRQSPYLRALLRDMHRGLREQGHTSFREARHEALTQAREPDEQR